jgi:type II secretory pathway component PulC
MNINSNVLFNNITTFLGVIVMATMINVILFTLLPKQGVEILQANNNDLMFSNYAKLFEENKKLTVVAKIVQKSSKNKNSESISNMTLKAIYAKGENEGWIIVKSTSSVESHIVENNETFKGFELLRFYENYVVFEKENIEYRLQMKSAITPKLNVFKKRKHNEKDIIIEKDKIVVNRDFLNNQIENEQKLVNDISLREKKQLGNIIGFEILSVTKNSFFDKVNIKKGDIIKSVNNQDVNDYNKLLSLYKNIDDMDLLIIKINRKNKDMELRYEIN